MSLSLESTTPTHHLTTVPSLTSMNIDSLTYLTSPSEIELRYIERDIKEMLMSIDKNTDILADCNKELNHTKSFIRRNSVTQTKPNKKLLDNANNCQSKSQ